MRSVLCLSLLVPLTVLAAQTEVALPSDVDLFVGGQKVLTIPRVMKLAVGDVAIADLKAVGNDEVVLIGMGQGETTLRVWLKGSADRIDIKIHVAKGVLPPPPAVVIPLADKRPAQQLAAGDDEVTLKLGEERIFTFPGITRVAVGDADIVDIKTVGNDKLLMKAGPAVASTTVLVWSGEPRKAILVHVVK